ncbi:MAG: serine/threonine protein kinase [Polyangiaceae bacterium]
MSIRDEILQPDSTVGSGRYRVVRLLGRGAQGQTLEAVDQDTGAPVAIKRFSVLGAESWKDVELAEREARVLSQLDHPNLPKHLDHFEEDGALYLVMTLVRGRSLEQLRRDGVLLKADALLRLLRDLTETLDYLRSCSPPVIHRDIKPGNIILRPDGGFTLVDFGSVRDHLKPDGSTVSGTFGYMAPEQFQGRALIASDIYGLGATLLTMLSGVEPENQPHRGLGIDVRKALGRNASEAWIALLQQMLEPDPDVRVANLTPLVRELNSTSSDTSSAAPVEQTEPVPRGSPHVVTPARRGSGVRRASASAAKSGPARTDIGSWLVGAAIVLAIVASVTGLPSVFSLHPVISITGTVALLVGVVFWVAVSGLDRRRTEVTHERTGDPSRLRVDVGSEPPPEVADIAARQLENEPFSKRPGALSQRRGSPGSAHDPEEP